MARGAADRPEEAVIVSLDRYSAQQLQLPADPRYWPRAGRALMIDRLTEAGATTIVLDTYLERETDPANDEALAQAIARSGKVVLLTRLVPADMLPASGNSGIAANAMPAVGLADPVPMFSHVRALAPFPLPTGEDRLCRTWAFIADLGDRPTLPAVALQIHLLPVMEKWRSLLAEAGVRPSALSAADRHALDHPGEVVRTMLMLRRAFLKEAGLAVRLREILKARHDDWSLPEKEALGALIRLYAGPDSRYLNLYGYQGRIRTISYADIVDPAVDISGLGLSGKVIFVGNSDPSPVYNSDSHRTVFSTAEGLDISGVEIGATAFLNLLKGSDLRQPDVASRTAILLLSGFVFGLAAYLLPVPAALALAAAAACLYFGGTFLAFTRLNFWPPVAVPLLVQAAAQHQPEPALLPVAARGRGAADGAGRYPHGRPTRLRGLPRHRRPGLHHAVRSPVAE
jgi:adenylate cyclase